jgi:tRNA-2-methylthio-N6-dimethylallyladenosine synthase
MEKKFYIKTFGCQMNEDDSERMKGILLSMGYREVEDPSSADIIIVNTCTVRAKSEHKALSFLGRMKKFKNKGAVIGITGCVAQEMKENLFTQLPFLDFIMGPPALTSFKKLIERIEKGERKIILTERDGEANFPYEKTYLGKVKAYVTVMEGCNNFCSYCIVPFVRGREISRRPEDIIRECEFHADNGIKEVILLGQNVNSYGKDLGTSLAELIKRISLIDGIKRIRFLTSHPKDLTDDIIRCFGEVEKLCEHIHLPAQSGSNKILKAMNRKYTREDYLTLIRKLRSVRPDIAITSDFIVGFPGETEEDFKETLSLVEEVRFDNFFSFKYSPRPGTSAEKLPDDVPPEEKTRRIVLLQEIQKRITLEINSSLIGKEEEVLVEGMSKNTRKGKVVCQLFGRTRKNKIVNFFGDEKLIGSLINVKIKEALANDLIGEYN